MKSIILFLISIVFFLQVSYAQDTIVDSTSVKIITDSLLDTNLVPGSDTVVAVFDEIDQEAEKLYNRGISKFQKGIYESAVADFSEAISLKPDFEKAYFNRASARYEMKDYNGAIEDCNKVESLNPKLGGAFFLKGRCNYALGKKT